MPKAAVIEDALQAAPNNYKLLFENDRVRMLDLSIDPGDRVAMHHLKDHLMYVVTDCSAEFTSSEGESQQCGLSRGQAQWYSSKSQEIANKGNLPMQVIIVEFKY